MIPMHTSACAHCVTKETSFIEPTRLVDGDGIETQYAYKCPDCGTKWEAVSNNDARDLPGGHPKRRASAK